ncbi:MAG: hypothetical protein AAF533_11775 [Acidobacteriota bacterium]
MSIRPLTSCAAIVLALALAVAATPPSAHATGARSFKSGPIQVTADGAWVWLVNPDHDSVARIDAAGGTFALDEYPLPGPGPHRPRGIAVSEDGSEVWVACHDSDKVFVLDGTDGTVLSEIDMPWGSGPYSVALSRPDGLSGQQRFALVTLHRGDAVMVLDAVRHAIIKHLSPTYRSPHAVTFTEDGQAWVMHLFPDGEHPRISRVDFADPADPKYLTRTRVFPTFPQRSSSLAASDPAGSQVAEGGYQTTRGHAAQVPNGVDGGRLWLSVQYQNIHEDTITPDSIIQATVRKVTIPERRMHDTLNNNDKVILTAPHVHQIRDGGAHVGPGWNLPVSGFIDLGFTTDGSTAYLLFEQSDNLVEIPTDLPPVSDGRVLRSVDVGSRPMGLALSPTADLAFTANNIDRTVSVIDLATMTELTRIASTTLPDPIPANILNGARLFHTSRDVRISVNDKVSCASCHLNAEHDGRSWDLQWLTTDGSGNATGPGFRFTQTLLGLSLSMGPIDPATGFGQLHRSGDRDEVQDFEHTFRGAQMGGLGFVADPDLQAPLGASQAGFSTDLDDIADYVLDLPPLARSPHRAAGGALSPAAIRGATFFLGSDPALPADGGCAVCHVPESGFTDFTFHDVGQRRDNGENELNNRAPYDWHVNTPSLVGAWTTAPYVGTHGWAENLIDSLVDFNDPARPFPHGDLSGLTVRQMRDIQEFLLSIDGDMTAAEVRSARDDRAPRIVRVEPVSLTRIAVWFDESIDLAAGNPASFAVTDLDGGPPIAVTAAVVDPQNQDRVDLTVDTLRAHCTDVSYEVSVMGPIPDLAATASGNTTNTLRPGMPGSSATFAFADTLTITMGSSGYDSITVPTHDVSTMSGLTGWNHGSLWLSNDDNGRNPNTGLVRFEWSGPFQATTGVTDSNDIVDAAVILHPAFGDSQDIEVYRMLVDWQDTGGGDWNSNPTGGPTWRDAARGSRPWNAANANATAMGVDGSDPSHYDGGQDRADTPDHASLLTAINEPTVIDGPRVTDAARFWMDNPALDYGYGIKLLPNQWNETKWHGAEAELRAHPPELRITYQLPLATVAPPTEVSAPGSAVPFRIDALSTGYQLRFEDIGAAAERYNLYEGTIGDFTSHVGRLCHVEPTRVTGRAFLDDPLGSGSHYYLIAAAGRDLEGPLGADSYGRARNLPATACGPTAPCP